MHVYGNLYISTSQCCTKLGKDHKDAHLFLITGRLREVRELEIFKKEKQNRKGTVNHHAQQTRDNPRALEAH